jgi:hypothetical protein
VWIDASHEITSKSFVREALDARHDGVAAFKHPRRDCIYDEAEASLGAEGQGGKYESQPLLEQVARLPGRRPSGARRAVGVRSGRLGPRQPERRRARKSVARRERRWSWQDQLSLPVAARRLGITPGVFPVRQIERSDGRGFLANRWLRIWAHVAAPEPRARRGARAECGVGPDPVHVRLTSTAKPHASHVFAWYAQPLPDMGDHRRPLPTTTGRKAPLSPTAARRASHDLLVIADADCIIEPPEILQRSRADRVAAGAAVGRAAQVESTGCPRSTPNASTRRRAERRST